MSDQNYNEYQHYFWFIVIMLMIFVILIVQKLFYFILVFCGFNKIDCFYLKCVQNNSYNMLILRVKYFYLQISFFVLSFVCLYICIFDTVLSFSKLNFIILSFKFNFWRTNSDFIITK